MRRSRVRLLVAAPFWADTKRAVSGRGRNGLQNMDCVSGNPSGEKIGGVPERSKGSDCKSDGYAFEGSNPSPTTNKRSKSRKKSLDGLTVFWPGV